jgi:hypothetical protein
MNTYTFTEAVQNLDMILDKAAYEGEVRIRQRDGRLFIIRPAEQNDSPLDVNGLDLNLGIETILQCIEEGRRSL